MRCAKGWVGTHLVRYRAGRIVIPAGIGMTTGWQIVPHLDHREHTTHLQWSEGSCSGHHRQCVRRSSHMAGVRMTLMFSHAVLSHGHIPWQQLADGGIHP